MSDEQKAYEAGWYAGIEHARKEAVAVVGPKFFKGNASLAAALKRRERMLFWIYAGVDLVFAIPVVLFIWGLLTHAATLQSRCNDCLCAPQHAASAKGAMP